MLVVSLSCLFFLLLSSGHWCWIFFSSISQEISQETKSTQGVIETSDCICAFWFSEAMKSDIYCVQGWKWISNLYKGLQEGVSRWVQISTEWYGWIVDVCVASSIYASLMSGGDVCMRIRMNASPPTLLIKNTLGMFSIVSLLFWQWTLGASRL